MSRTIEISLPDCLEIKPDEIRMVLAAEIAGISKRQFLETVGKYGVSIFQYTAAELQEDLARLRANRS